jgi:hypothetical protein
VEVRVLFGASRRPCTAGPSLSRVESRLQPPGCVATSVVAWAPFSRRVTRRGKPSSASATGPVSAAANDDGVVQPPDLRGAETEQPGSPRCGLPNCGALLAPRAAGRSGHCANKSSIYAEHLSADVGGCRRQQECSDAPELLRTAVTSKRDRLLALRANFARRDPAEWARRSSSSLTRSVSMRPGAMPLTRMPGASSADRRRHGLRRDDRRRLPSSTVRFQEATQDIGGDR